MNERSLNCIARGACVPPLAPYVLRESLDLHPHVCLVCILNVRNARYMGSTLEREQEEARERGILVLGSARSLKVSENGKMVV